MDLRLQRLLAEAEAQDILTEIGKKISSKSAKSLKDALSAMQIAMEQVSVLISDENEKIETVDGKIVETKKPVWMRWSFDEVSKILAKDDSFDARRCAVQAALRIKYQNEMLAKKLSSGNPIMDDNYYADYYYSDYPYIKDLYDADVIYSSGSDLYQATYTFNDGVVTVSDGVVVKISYVAESSDKIEHTPIIERGEYESANLGTLIQLNERAVAEDGKVQIKIISPGWGSSGYYSKEMLERDAKVFKKGTHMYINHPTDREARERPERDIRDLAGVLLEDAVWESKGQSGPGLYSPASVLPAYREFIDAAAPYIGTSIRASGIAKEGKAEGKYGMIVEKLEDAFSVDYVTLPGRGGEVLPLLEVARTSMNDRRDHIKELEEVTKVELESKDEMNEDQIKALISESVTVATKPLIEQNTTLTGQLEESEKKITRMTEGLILRDAKDIVVGTLASLKLPDMVKSRLAIECAKNPPVKEGALDRETLIESVKTAAIEEMKYVESFAGANVIASGNVNGLGSNNTTELTEADAQSALEEAFAELGFSNNALKIAVKGRD